MSDPSDVATAALSAFEVAVQCLRKSDQLDAMSGYSGHAGADLECIFKRSTDGRSVALGVQAPLYEVVTIEITGGYSDAATAYEPLDQIDNIETFLGVCEKFIRGDFSESPYVDSSGQSVGGKITFVDQYGQYSPRSYSLKSPAGLRGVFRRLASKLTPPS